MHSKRLLDLLVIGLSAFSVAEATFVNGRVDVRNVKAIQQRQEIVADTPGAATNSDTPTPTPSTVPSTTPAPKPSSQPPKPSEPSTPPPDTSSKTTLPTEPSPSSPKPDTSTTSSTKPPAEQTTAPPNSPSQEPSKPVIKTITNFSTVTNSDGTKSTLTSEVLTTQTPGLAENNNNGGGGSGMSPQTRNTVIGVVVGVGGAIILIGLGFVAWRIWGRKKNQDEGLMDYSTPNDGKSEVGGSMSGRTPFQSTLESYHAPTNVNQAANF